MCLFPLPHFGLQGFMFKFLPKLPSVDSAAPRNFCEVQWCKKKPKLEVKGEVLKEMALMSDFPK